MKEDVMKFQQENKELKERVNEVTMMLYNKIEENQQLQKKMEQNQMQHTMFLTKLLLNNQGGETTDPSQIGVAAGSPSQMQSQIQNQLQSYL